MDEDTLDTRTPGKNQPKGADVSPSTPSSESPEKNKDQSSNKAKEDEKVDKATDELTKEVKKMEWEKHNFEAFDSKSMSGITGKLVLDNIYRLQIKYGKNITEQYRKMRIIFSYSRLLKPKADRKLSRVMESLSREFFL